MQNLFFAFGSGLSLLGVVFGAFGRTRCDQNSRRRCLRHLK